MAIRRKSFWKIRGFKRRKERSKERSKERGKERGEERS